ncbi:serine O-acetyltransferase [Terriglobus tenax]|uniref:serine O-acetyltransferase n=1 Tax=Terriglobus tenax TaxID=1111115 RepID=UPI0021E048B6|nr:DapH/DapD/GlmU-related protein [Terriglobus tenax]
MFAEFKEDLKRYREFGESYRRIALNPAVWCIFWYRLGRWIYRPGRNLLVRGLGKPLHLAVATVMEALMQMRLNVRAEIGPGLLIAHCGGITLHPEVVIGKHCDLAHHVTLGTRGVGSVGAPRLGDNVYIGTNAVLIGPILVGDGARVAANSLVNRDVPAGATVMGVPAAIVKRRMQPEEMAGAEVSV